MTIPLGRPSLGILAVYYCQYCQYWLFISISGEIIRGRVCYNQGYPVLFRVYPICQRPGLVIWSHHSHHQWTVGFTKGFCWELSFNIQQILQTGHTLPTVDLPHHWTPYTLWTCPTAEQPAHCGPASPKNTLLTLDLPHCGTPYSLWTCRITEHCIPREPTPTRNTLFTRDLPPVDDDLNDNISDLTPSKLSWYGGLCSVLGLGFRD